MKQLLTTLAIFSMSSLVFISCNDKEDTEKKDDIRPTFDIAGAKKLIDSANAAFVALFAKGDSVGLAAMYTSDGKTMPPNMPAVSGRAAIQNGFGGLFSTMGPSDLKITTTDVWGDEKMLVEEGTFVMSQKDKEIDRAKYIVVWKQEDGKWKIFRDIFNSDNPPPPSR